MGATGKRVPLSIGTAVSSTINSNSVEANLICPQSMTHKKYLGEPEDPHYIPDSPWIERQFFTEDEEAELKASCKLVLANVPHSDDMSDDPLKYIAAQIQEGKATHQSKTKSDRMSAPAHRIEASKTNSAIQHLLNSNPDTATPSDSSHRDTISTQDYSTPLTSAGFTPGDSARRFSDAARKSYNSTRKPGSSLRNDSQLQKSRTTSNSGLHRSFDTTNPSLETEAIKRTLRLVTDGSSRPQSGSSLRSMDNVNSLRFSSPDLNKSLPPPPADLSEQLDDPKQQPHISRLMKTIRKKKSMTALDKGRSLSTSDAPPPLPTSSRGKATQPSKPAVPKTSFAPQTSQEEPSKKRFRLRLFTRRHHQPANVLVS